MVHVGLPIDLWRLAAPSRMEGYQGSDLLLWLRRLVLLDRYQVCQGNLVSIMWGRDITLGVIGSKVL